jgi:competence protein ComEA
VEPSSTPWRVFDAPADGGAPAATAGKPALPAPLRSQVAAISALLAAIAVGVLAVLVAVSSSGGEVVDGPAVAIHSGGPDGPEVAPGEVVVDVSGAVTTPGLYHLAAGSRVGDAVEAAGGFSPRVDAARVGAELNLAANLTDGAQVHVPSRDDPKTADASHPPVMGSSGQLVNINTATEAELDALAGIGPVTAGKIIESRAAAPFKTVDELRERGLLGQKAFDKIKTQLTVG